MVHYCDYNIPPPRKGILYLEVGCSNFSEASVEFYQPTRLQSQSTIPFFTCVSARVVKSFIVSNIRISNGLTPLCGAWGSVVVKALRY